ncbi:MRG/MORF4L-binding protein [Euwallacea fornicatus]|uniref:MRG/MORF4L-binding protein n=1 Tax=Euwallacea fornicatus TaxID=995702 RepID=UPI00338D6540
MEDIEWNVVNEGQLLDAMVGHKPVGVNKYFQMALICDKLAENLRKDVNPEKIWAHLQTMYNLEVLDDNESIPFPNVVKEFSLPSEEFGELLIKKEDEDKKQGGKEVKWDDKSLPKGGKESTPRWDKDNNGKASTKKESKKEGERPKGGKGRNSTATPKEEKGRETPKPAKRTRGSLKPNDDSSSSGKSSPVTVTPSPGKRRRVV